LPQRAFFWRTQTQAENKPTMANVRRLIHRGRPPSTAAAATRGATNLISEYRGTFCGSAAVVGGSGDECGRFVVAATAIYTLKGQILDIPHQSTG
jgi:5,10-methylene-tetrahydrofolate dehydrogenase/methenyl tetrahydrofolate cyclohydrolase